MDSPSPLGFGTRKAESDIYRFDGAYHCDHASVASSADEFAEPDSMSDDGDLSAPGRQQIMRHSQPPPISTDWDEGGGEGVEIAADEHETLGNDAQVSFKENPAEGVAATIMPISSSSAIHFQDPKRYNYASPYPTQSLRSGADSSFGQAATDKTKNGRNGGERRKRLGHPPDSAASLAEVTPAFLRRAAQDLGVSNGKTINAAAGGDPLPPNSLANRRDRQAATSSSAILGGSFPDSSFYGADASALDGTFVSIRDLNEEDDVPSVDSGRWNSTDRNKGGADASFPTETTSLLGGRQMPWQGGFFGSQMEREDRRERRRMRRARGGWFAGWMWAAPSYSGWKRGGLHSDDGRGSRWEGSRPIGNDFAPRGNDNHAIGGSSRRCAFSLFLSGALCFNMLLCGLHDIFLRYLSYRNPYDEGEAEVSWNGEGKYLPAYWVSFNGRVLNPFVGPGARTLTAFGALVPGLVLSKGQKWRVVTALFQTTSLVQLILHIWALKSAVGGSLIGLEWKRGTFVPALLYLITALIGSAWSIAVEPGRLVTASGMGIAGLLAVAAVERSCFPLASKDDEDEKGTDGHHGAHIGNSNAVSSSSNEQFSYQPPNPHKKKRRDPLNYGTSPTLILLLEITASWWAAYASLIGTVTAAIAGAAGGLLLFVGHPPLGYLDRVASRDLLLSEDAPPPPPAPKFSTRVNWRDDDDSADTSIGSDKHTFNTPLMRRSILADEDEEDAPLGTRVSLRKRNGKGTSVKTNGAKGHFNNEKPLSASCLIARVIGVLLAILLTLIPTSLIATGRGPTNELTRASMLGCRPMRILYRENDNTDLFECAGGCIPLSRERVARKKEGMQVGRCDAIGFRCWQQSGTMELHNYGVTVGIYVVPTDNGSCGDGAGYVDNDNGSNNNDNANNG